MTGAVIVILRSLGEGVPPLNRRDGWRVIYLNLTPSIPLSARREGKGELMSLRGVPLHCLSEAKTYESHINQRGMTKQSLQYNIITPPHIYYVRLP
jgi:hypothetical protein